MSDTQRFGTVVVPPPTRPPRGATLLRSVNVETPSDERWVQGIIWQPDSCGDGEIVQATGFCGNGTFAGFDAPVGRPDVAEFVPPMVAVGQSCSGISGEAELLRTAERARNLLERCQTVGIARELWRGDIAQAETPDFPNDWLSKDATDVGGGIVGVIDALAALEQGLADCSCGGQGVIHAMPYLATLWSATMLVERQADGRLLTALGTLVVADPGYDGSGESGASGDPLASSWAYATSMVDVRLGTARTTGDPQTLNISNNDFDVYAYRPFSATFDPCCHLGVQVDHTDRS